MTRLPPVAELRHLVRQKDVIRSTFSVTDFGSQACEVKALYRRLIGQIGPVPEHITRRMNLGTEYHKEIEINQMGAPAAVPVHLINRSVEHALKMLDMADRLNMLAEGRSVRELRAPGRVGLRGVRLNGVIDGVAVENGELTIIETKTTGRLPPSSWKINMAYHQTLLYHIILRQMLKKTYDVSLLVKDLPDSLDLPDSDEAAPVVNRFESYGLKPTLTSAYSIVEAALGRIQNAGLRVTERILIEYVLQRDTSQKKIYSVLYDDSIAQDLTRYSTDLWVGSREPLSFTLDGRSVCNFCEYKTECELAPMSKN